jgi:hypothetical protein
VLGKLPAVRSVISRTTVPLVYAGGLFGFDDCEVDAYTELHLTGAAARTEALVEKLQSRPELLSHFPPFH